jgi:hypothetical protein
MGYSFSKKGKNMLKREINYEDFNGETVTDTYYFNLTKSEILGLEASYNGGLDAAIKRIIDAKDSMALIAEFQKIFLLAYGIKSDDGKRFMKSDQLRDEFSQTAAYDVLFMELATNDKLAADFMIGIMPKDLAKAAEAQQQQLGA